MLLNEKTLDSKLIFDGKVIRVYHDSVELPNGRRSMREIVSHNGGCCIVPVTDEGQILLVKQFRYPYKEVILEIPAGKLEKGEDIALCAERELKEETGATADRIEYLGGVYPSPGYTDEIIHIFAAYGLKRGEMSLDEDEFLDVTAVDGVKAIQMIESGEIKDAKTIIGILRTAKSFIK